jgi:hypothetical protein
MAEKQQGNLVEMKNGKTSRNFVAHASQTVRFNAGQHKNKKRGNELKGRHSKHKGVNSQLHDC